MACKGECKSTTPHGRDLWAEVVYAGRRYFPYVVVHTCPRGGLK